MIYDTGRTKEDWTRDFGLLTSAEQHDVVSRWEKRARRLSVHIPPPDGLTMMEYAWAVRCAVVEHSKTVLAEGKRADRRAIWSAELGTRGLFLQDEVLDAMERAYQEAVTGRGYERSDDDETAEPRPS